VSAEGPLAARDCDKPSRPDRILRFLQRETNGLVHIVVSQSTVYGSEILVETDDVRNGFATRRVMPAEEHKCQRVDRARMFEETSEPLPAGIIPRVGFNHRVHGVQFPEGPQKTSSEMSFAVFEGCVAGDLLNFSPFEENRTIRVSMAK